MTNGSQRYPLTEHGLHDWKTAWWDLPGPQLVEASILRQEGLLADNDRTQSGVTRRDKAQERDAAERRVTPDWAVRTKPLAFAADAAGMA
ncbi:MAG: hypothetical protein ACRD44_14470, partial [Bryobacteraceae bacterium]